MRGTRGPFVTPVGASIARPGRARKRRARGPRTGGPRVLAQPPGRG